MVGFLNMENDEVMKRLFTKNPYEGFLRRIQHQAEQKKKDVNPVHEIVNMYYILNGWQNQPKVFFQGRYSYGRLASQAKKLLEACNQNLEDALWCLDKMKYLAERGKFDWTISTCLEHELRWGK